MTSVQLGVTVTVAGESVTVNTDVTVNGTADPSTWLEVAVGPGINKTTDGQRRIVVPAADQYPNSVGVSFWHNGVFNRTDATGRNEGSEYHTYPVVTLAEGDVLRAEWDDLSGVHRISTYTVPVTSEPPAEEPPPPPPPPPVPGDRPSPTNTGHDGNLTRTFSGTTITQAWIDANNGGSLVLENVRFNGQVTVKVNNLTIRNFEVNGGAYGVYNDVFTGNPSVGLVLEDGEFMLQGSSGIAVSNCTVRRCYFHNQVADGVKIWSNNVIEDCYFTDMGNGTNPTAHADGIQQVAGNNNIIRRNNFEMPYQSSFLNSICIIIQTNDSPINNITIDSNWINGGGYSLHVNDKGNGNGYPTNVAVTNNRFGRDYQFGPIRFSGGTPETATGNVWDDTGEPI